VKKIKQKMAYLTTIILSVVMLTPIGFVVAEQTNNLSAANGAWEPPQNFEDPVTLKIQELRLQGLSDGQITVKLAETGMGWYPETGATWMGRTLTSQELAEMPSTTLDTSTTVASGQYAPAAQYGRTSCMRTNDASWTGISSEIVSGSMSVSSGQTRYHYLCMQLGDLDGQTSWVETVLTHNLGEAYRWSTFDTDEGGWAFYLDKDTPITAADTYTVLLDGTQDSYGWHYNIWINNQWVRNGHLSSLWVQGGLQKEVYTEGGSFTNDASHALFYRNWLHNAQGWTYWTNSINTWWSTVYPLQESHSVGTLSYRWESWVQY
jgi:hypothetical protein